MDLLNVIFRTVLFYFIIAIAYRFMGKREVGQLGIIDLIVSILIAELVAISIEENNEPIILTIVPILLLVVIEISLAKLTLKSRKFRNMFNGKPSTIILNGKINYKEMEEQRYSLDDLLLQLRQQSIRSIDDVEYALLETNGKLSVFKYNALKIKGNYPLPIIIDGRIQFTTLKTINKTPTWLINKLKKMEIPLHDAYYAFYKTTSIYVVRKSSII